MATKTKRIYTTEPLPYDESVEQFAPQYISEKFTNEEQAYLRPFFSNIDKPLFVVQHLPEEVIGALSSRYSRATQSLRRMFLKEYIAPIARPEEQKNWETLSAKDKKEALQTKELFQTVIDRLNKGEGIDAVVNVQRGRKFFDTWLAQYGDDSIAEMGGIHMCIEYVSNVVIKEMQDKRIGLSPLEKSTRYVQFWEKRSDGKYQYVTPGELRGSKYEKEYEEVMDGLFDTYSQIAQGYLDYIKKLYPMGEDETEKSFENSRSAKRFDDIRDLLPFSTQTSFAMFGNGRAFEDLINRLMAHPLGECRWWGQAICEELEKVVPSFVSRPKTVRGAEVQLYRTNMLKLKEELSSELSLPEAERPKRWAVLISSTPDADIEVLSAYLFAGMEGVSLLDIRKQVRKMGVKKRKEWLRLLLDERRFNKKEVLRQEARFRKVPRAFENAHFTFALWGRGGDYRDLHRHRLLTQERQRFTTKWGYDLEKEMVKSPFINSVKAALERAEKLYGKLEKFSPHVAQYVVPFGYLQHWYMQMTAREIYWMIELRTGPQGRPHYREICQQIAKEAMKASPAVFGNLMTDWNDYSLSRRESEKKIDKKLRALEKSKK